MRNAATHVLAAAALAAVLASTALAAPLSAAPRPFASATLLVNDATKTLRLLNETNVAVRFAPGAYSDLAITRPFDVICVLPNGFAAARFSVRADSAYNLIPADVVDYQSYDPSYVKLEINPQYFTDRIDDSDVRDHIVRIEFYADRE